MAKPHAKPFGSASATRSESGSVPKSHVKGSIMLGVVKALRAQGDAVREVMPEHVRHYLDDRILLSSWYSEDDAMDLYRVMARTLPNLGPDPFFTMGRVSAIEHAKTVYKHLVGGRAPRRSLERADAMWKVQHDTGEMRVVGEWDGQAAIELRGHARLSDEWCRLLAGYFVGMVEATGGKHARCNVSETDYAAGRALFTVSYG